jgi:hypothetical protein
VTTWQFGGAMTVEAYVKFEALGYYARLFEFADGSSDDAVRLYHQSDTTGTAAFDAMVGSSANGLDSSSSTFLIAGSWVHIVAAIGGTTMSLYKDGNLSDFTSNSQEPAALTRAEHRIGGSPFLDRNLEGTIAYVRFWHGQALGASQVAELYANRLEGTGYAATSALVALYEDTGGGSSWATKANWMDGHPCTQSWYGLTCSSSGKPVNVEMQSNGMVGSLPTEVGDLASLRLIDDTESSFLFRNNELTGDLPTGTFTSHRFTPLLHSHVVSFDVYDAYNFYYFYLNAK